MTHTVHTHKHPYVKCTHDTHERFWENDHENGQNEEKTSKYCYR